MFVVIVALLKEINLCDSRRLRGLAEFDALIRNDVSNFLT